MESQCTLQGILEENSDVFKLGLGKLNGVTAKLYVDPSVQPRFHKPSPLPFTLRSKVDEVDRLQGLGLSCWYSLQTGQRAHHTRTKGGWQNAALWRLQGDYQHCDQAR